MPITPSKSLRTWPKSQATPFKNVHADEFYNSATWRRFRHGYLARNPLCVSCAKQGKTVPAKVVDHIIPLLDGGDKFDYSNLQGLCTPCHNTKSINKRWGNKQ